MSIYELKSDLDNYSYLREIRQENYDKFYEEHWNWKPLKIQHDYCFKLLPNQYGRKNYQSDISIATANYCIFSEKAIDVLFPLLQGRGEFFDIITPSKRKKFRAFYPYKNVYPHSIVNLEKSDVTFYDNGTHHVSHAVFYSSAPQHEPIFVVDEMELSIFVNDEFKQLVEQHELKGFDFSEMIPIMD